MINIFFPESTVGTSMPMTSYEEPGQLITPNHQYESPGTAIHVGNLYEDLTYSISQQNSVKTPPKNNNFQYDYATREGTSLLPLTLNGDVIFEYDTSGPQSSREKRDDHTGQSDQKPFYHTLDEDATGTDKNSSEQSKLGEKQQSQEMPYYHTLDEDPSGTDRNLTDQSKLSEKGDSHPGLPHEKHVYETLEENTSPMDPEPSNTDGKKPLYHTLENETSHPGKEGKKNEKPREQPVYQTLENDYEEI